MVHERSLPCQTPSGGEVDVRVKLGLPQRCNGDTPNKAEAPTPLQQKDSTRSAASSNCLQSLATLGAPTLKNGLLFHQSQPFRGRVAPGRPAQPADRIICRARSSVRATSSCALTVSTASHRAWYSAASFSCNFSGSESMLKVCLNSTTTSANYPLCSQAHGNNVRASRSAQRPGQLSFRITDQPDGFRRKGLDAEGVGARLQVLADFQAGGLADEAPGIVAVDGDPRGGFWSQRA